MVPAIHEICHMNSQDLVGYHPPVTTASVF
jgi:hypothetical protein